MAQRTPAQGSNILIVDDTPANLSLLTSVLKDRGHRVRPVLSGALALKTAQAEAPDLILLDISMPQMDGFEVCRRLKESERLRSVPVIFLSALSDTVDKVKAFSMGGVDYVTKPFQIEELEARVETHLSLRRLQLRLVENYERLQSLEQMRQKLTQMIVHDLKSPITAAYYNATFVRDDAGLQGDHAVAMERVVSSFDVLNRMTLDMLDVAKSDTGSLRPRLERTDLRGLLKDVAADAGAAAQSAGKTLIVDVAGDVPAVGADRELLRRVMANLLDNSFKYAPEGTELRVEAALAAGGNYSIRLRDQGPGIPRADRERIFDPYVRLERDAADHARESRGLGLAFCRLAAEAHGGRIWVEDNQPKGTTFVVQLPIDPAAAPKAEEPTPGTRGLAAA